MKKTERKPKAVAQKLTVKRSTLKDLGTHDGGKHVKAGGGTCGRSR